MTTFEQRARERAARIENPVCSFDEAVARMSASQWYADLMEDFKVGRAMYPEIDEVFRILDIMAGKAV